MPRKSLCVAWIVAVLAPATSAQELRVQPGVPRGVEAVLETYCLTCHDEGTREGDVNLDALPGLSLDDRLELLNRVHEQVYFETMPPEKKRQPTAAERRLLADWVSGVLQEHGGSRLEDKLRYPEYGNYVDHESLFSRAVQDEAFTPARRWLVSPQIFAERVLDVFGLSGRERESQRRRGFHGVTNPLVLPESSGVRYYDNGVLDGGHLLVMLTNAEWISTKQLHAARIEAGEVRKGEFPNPKDRWYPKTTPAAFAQVVLKETAPTDEELEAAVQQQFARVLQRPARDEELASYMELTRAAIELGGNTEGLRRMLVSVLLESEFLYRLELGAGEPDEHGRRMLSPREASYAVAYALGDRSPDPALVEAAAQGRLSTRDDVRREALRLLADDTYFRGPIDGALEGKHTRSLVTSHPKIIRFFREFFGYPGALRVFKDLQRSDGYFRNPDRSDPQTPGRLVSEADLLVEWCVRKDERVFENLLGTELFFAAPVADAGAKIDKLNALYDHFENFDWKEDSETVAAENLELIREVLHHKGGAKQLTLAMTHVEKFRAKGLNPHPVWDYPFGRLLTRWVASYDIESFDWEYPREQPFRLPNRKGILTHPAWLIAHSANTATDPVRRGRWVREKLLAGRVPDLPITVDAQVPEVPDRTLRERLAEVTEKRECWKCHQHMNPLGYPFEVYDDFGRFRTEESLEHPDNFIAKTTKHNGADIYETRPVNAAGRLDGTGDPELDGEVEGALDLIDRLIRSDRVRQSIIRHAFRYWMGRNERLSDSRTLIDADRAYVESGGSFEAVVVSLMTSDSFLYRK